MCVCLCLTVTWTVYSGVVILNVVSLYYSVDFVDA